MKRKEIKREIYTEIKEIEKHLENEKSIRQIDYSNGYMYALKTILRKLENK